VFDRLAIDWMRAASQKAVADRLHLSWDEIHAIQERAVARGLARREAETIPYLGVDEKSFTRSHRYFTLASDLDLSRVLYVTEEDRTEASLDGFWSGLTARQIDGVKAIAMDMWDPHINSTLNHLPEAQGKIVFDKFRQTPLRSRRFDSAQGEHTVAGLGRRPAHRSPLRLVEASGENGPRGPARVCHPERQRAENRACLGVEGIHDGLLQLHLRTARPQALPLVAQLGGSQPAPAHDR
jgi:hypothetical protein